MEFIKKQILIDNNKDITLLSGVTTITTGVTYNVVFLTGTTYQITANTINYQTLNVISGGTNQIYNVNFNNYNIPIFIKQNFINLGYYIDTPNTGITTNFYVSGVTGNTSARMWTGNTDTEFYSETRFYNDYFSNTFPYITGNTASRLEEFRDYGGGYLSGASSTGYTIDNIINFSDSGTTALFNYYSNSYTGSTFTGFTTNYDERFMGLVEEPAININIFIDRTTFSVTDRIYKFCEITSIENIDIYGNDFFFIKNI